MTPYWINRLSFSVDAAPKPITMIVIGGLVGVVESISMSDVSMCVHVPAYACVDGRKLFVY
jgi:hypothetical protein